MPTLAARKNFAEESESFCHFRKPKRRQIAGIIATQLPGPARRGPRGAEPSSPQAATFAGAWLIDALNRVAQASQLRGGKIARVKSILSSYARKSVAFLPPKDVILRNEARPRLRCAPQSCEWIYARKSVAPRATPAAAPSIFCQCRLIPTP